MVFRLAVALFLAAKHQRLDVSRAALGEEVVEKAHPDRGAEQDEDRPDRPEEA